jgi:hypothetical protein
VPDQGGSGRKKLKGEPLQCSVATVLESAVFLNLGWAVAHLAHPLAPPMSKSLSSVEQNDQLRLVSKETV